MANKKGQGISLSFIVIAALAVLVLVLVASFTVGGLGGFFSRLTTAGEETVGESDLTLAKSTCLSLCSDAKSVTNPGRWDDTRYCAKTYSFDLNRDGQISGDEAAVNCWESPINADCSTSMSDLFGATAICDDGDCDEGCPPIQCSGQGDLGPETACPSATIVSDCLPGCTWESNDETEDETDGTCSGTYTPRLPCAGLSRSECLANGCDWEQSAI